MNIKKKIVYVDLDDTIADFQKMARDSEYNFQESRMYSPEFFFKLPVIEGAREAVRQIICMGYDVWICTQPLANHFESYSDKAKWIQLYFPELYNKIVMTQDKGLCFGHYLIDDNKEKWGTKFTGDFIHFEYYKGNHKQQWEEVVSFLNNDEPTYMEKI